MIQSTVCVFVNLNIHEFKYEKIKNKEESESSLGSYIYLLSLILFEILLSSKYQR